MDKYDFMTVIFLLKDDVRYSPKDIYRKYCEVYEEFVALDAEKQVLEAIQKKSLEEKKKKSQ